jgi:HSP20 family protein
MLIREDPFRDLDRWSQQVWKTAQQMPVMPMDAYRHGDTFVLKFDLPGVEPASIDLTVEKNTLTVRADRKKEHMEEDEVLISERPQGSFTRQILLGEGLDVDHIHAGYELGVLTLMVPVSEAVKPRRLEIAVENERATVGAHRS